MKFNWEMLKIEVNLFNRVFTHLPELFSVERLHNEYKYDYMKRLQKSDIFLSVKIKFNSSYGSLYVLTWVGFLYVI